MKKSHLIALLLGSFACSSPDSAVAPKDLDSGAPVATSEGGNDTANMGSSPRIIAYSNSNTEPLLKDAESLPYTHYILSFLIPDGRGGVEPSGALKPVLADAATIQRVRSAGKKVLVSLGGGTVGGKDWLSLGENAVSVAESVAAIVEEHQLDGVDLDVEAVPYERQSEFQPYADAVVALTQELAKRLPGKLLTHAPQPPYLCRPGSPGGCPADSLYATILAATGDDITWLNMQYYSNPPLTSSNFEEVYHYRSVIKGWEGFPGLEAQRLVVGKPYSPRVNGFEPMDVVVKDILRPLAKEFGSSFGGFMAWEFNEDPEGAWANAVSQVLHEP